MVMMRMAWAMAMEIGRAAVRGLRGDPLPDPEILSQTRGSSLRQEAGTGKIWEMPTFPLDPKTTTSAAANILKNCHSAVHHKRLSVLSGVSRWVRIEEEGIILSQPARH